MTLGTITPLERLDFASICLSRYESQGDPADLLEARREAKNATEEMERMISESLFPTDGKRSD